MSEANGNSLHSLVGLSGFRCIVADPPWPYKSNGAPASWRPCLDRGEKPHSVTHYYQTMTLDQIAALPVRDIAQEKRHYSQPKETRGKPVGVVLPQAWGFEAMGCDWMKIDEASEAIPPAYTRWIAEQFLNTANNEIREGRG